MTNTFFGHIHNFFCLSNFDSTVVQLHMMNLNDVIVSGYSFKRPEQSSSSKLVQTHLNLIAHNFTVINDDAISIHCV